MRALFHRDPLRYAVLGLLTLGLAVAALGQATISVKPGLISYAEGQVKLAGSGAKPSGTNIHLQEKQRLLTDTGNVELLLSPVTLLRAGNTSDWEMVSSQTSNVVMKLRRGSGIVEVLAKLEGTRVKIKAGEAIVLLEHKGVYRFDATLGSVPMMKVLKGKAAVTIADEKHLVKAKRSIVLNGSSVEIAKLPAPKPDALESWHRQRSSLLARSFQGSRPAGRAARPSSTGSAFGAHGTGSIECENGTPALLN